MVVIVMGLPGSGKSYFAEKLATTLHADYVNSDRLRKDMFTVRTYSPEEKQAVYDRMHYLMREAILQQKDIVLDGTFYLNSIREQFTKDANVHFIEVIASPTITEERLQQTRTDSEADSQVYQLIKTQWEPLQEEHLVLRSTNDNITGMLQEATNYLLIK
jgi:predicted kinase